MNRNIEPSSHDLDKVPKLSNELFICNSVAEEIRRIRIECGLSQAELAKRTGTSPSVIARLENVEYLRHSTATLRKIGRALGYKLELRFVKPEQDG